MRGNEQRSRGEVRHRRHRTGRSRNPIPRQRKVSLSLNTLWLANQGMSPQYLSMPDLRLLAHARINPRDDGSFRTRLQALYGEIALTCAMALLAASLSLFYFAYRLRPVALIVTLLAGYLAHFAARALLLMGEFGYVWPIVAGWFMPLTLFSGGGHGILWHRFQKRRGLGASLQDTPLPQAAERLGA